MAITLAVAPDKEEEKEAITAPLPTLTPALEEALEEALAAHQDASQMVEETGAATATCYVCGHALYRTCHQCEQPVCRTHHHISMGACLVEYDYCPRCFSRRAESDAINAYVNKLIRGKWPNPFPVSAISPEKAEQISAYARWHLGNGVGTGPLGQLVPSPPSAAAVGGGGGKPPS
jgi:hypothetical protein